MREAGATAGPLVINARTDASKSRNGPPRSDFTAAVRRANAYRAAERRLPVRCRT